jgi:hypothetical protein
VEIHPQLKSPLKGTGLKDEDPLIIEEVFIPSLAIPAKLFPVYPIRRFPGSVPSCGIL